MSAFYIRKIVLLYNIHIFAKIFQLPVVQGRLRSYVLMYSRQFKALALVHNG